MSASTNSLWQKSITKESLLKLFVFLCDSAEVKATETTNSANLILCRQFDINYKVWYNYHFLSGLYNQLNNFHIFNNPGVF